MKKSFQIFATPFFAIFLAIYLGVGFYFNFFVGVLKLFKKPAMVFSIILMVLTSCNSEKSELRKYKKEIYNKNLFELSCTYNLEEKEILREVVNIKLLQQIDTLSYEDLYNLSSHLSCCPHLESYRLLTLQHLLEETQRPSDVASYDLTERSISILFYKDSISISK